MDKDRGDVELRRWAVELAARCIAPSASPLVDGVLVCQLADMLVAYVLTGSPIAGDAAPKGTRLM